MPTQTKTSFSYCYLGQEKQFVFFSELQRGYVYYKTFRINLLTHQKESFSLKSFMERLDQISVIDEKHEPHVFHLSYEFGYYSVGLYDLIPEDQPLVYELVYEKFKRMSPIKKSSKVKLKTIKKPIYSEYKNKFKRCYDQLLDGNCYQVNLTENFKIKVSEGEDSFYQMAFQENPTEAAYAHGTYLPKWDWGLISHSPECLFHLKQKNEEGVEISSMPIKGTIKKKGNESISKLWKKLTSDLKEEAELNMITDLIRNDLAKIDQPNSRVVKQKALLEIPGIIHQYSDVRSVINKNKTLADIVKNVFPGGSITGAPKKNVMKIINAIEEEPRGFYCGSTIIFHQTMRRASINIRSAEYFPTKKILKVGAGGGITLKSESEKEFLELNTKFESILSYFS